MMQQSARSRFRAALFGLGEHWESGVAQLGAQVVAGLPAFGHDTAAVAAAAGQLAVSVEEDLYGRRNLGLCLKDRDVRLVDVLWLADGLDVPEQVQQRWPGLPQQEWECALRVAKLVLSALGSPSIKNDRAVANPARDRFRAALSAVGDHPETPPQKLATDLTAGLLAFGSETPDNLAAAARLHVSIEQDENGWNVGLCMRQSGLRLSRLLEGALGSPLPQQLLEDFPELTQEDSDTVLTVTTAILAALESDRIAGSHS
ncbi:hypothetical protein AB0D08_05530 [Kitasatospora sp. NPDC048540]|uniref:hypothetical protein n=1 Tax=Kitasatospora sp. NPDC048540 TaxID=3155634 RepID=UPI0033DD12E3